jgi:hypothetical protein
LTLQLPRWETPKPPGVTGSYGPRARKWAERELGITLVGWQKYAVDNILRHDKRGDLIHRMVLLSTARQNGKSVIVRVVFGWMLDEGRCLPPFQSWTTLLAAAHDAKQARIIYRGVLGDMLKIDRLVQATKGRNSAVRLTEYFGVTVGDLTLDTVTGQPGSARGLSAGMIGYDEVLTQRDWEMWEAISPTQSAQRSPQIILTSTAGTVESVVLRAFYDRLLRQASGDEAPDPTFYGAWWQSESADAGLDWEELRRANPALGDGRLTEQAIRTEHAILPADSWRRERLNHWVDAVAPGAFNPGVWAKTKDFSEGRPLDGLTGPYALGIREHPGWERATVCVAGVRDDGRIGVEVYRDIRGTPDKPVTARAIIEAVDAFPDPLTVIAFDMASGAAPEFRRHAEETGQPWDELKPAAVVSACMDTTEMVQSGRLVIDDPLMDAQIAGAGRRNVGQDGAFRYSVHHSLGPIDAVLSMCFAAHAIAYKPPPVQVFF